MLRYNTKRDIGVLTECLDIGVRVLRNSGAKFWLSDGALWAIVREGEVFEHDHDFDIGILGDAQLPDLLDSFPSSFQKLEWSREVIFEKLQGFAFQYKSWIFDLRFWYDGGENLINAQRYPGENSWQVGTFYEPKRLFSNLGEINYHGIKVPIPSPVNEYLACRYGENWDTMPLTGENRWWLYTKSFQKNNNIWEKKNDKRNE